MEVSVKNKIKKRKTRRNLDEIRKRSRSEWNDQMNLKKESLLKIKNTSSYVKNAQITSKRLTLALYNNTVRSETVTRIALSKKDDKTNNNVNDTHKMNIISGSSKQFLNLNYASKSITENKILSLSKSKIQIGVQKYAHNYNVDVNDMSSSVILFTPLKHVLNENSYNISETVSKGYKHKTALLSNKKSSTCSDVDIYSGTCFYEKFMNELPFYLKEHFPELTKDVMNKNIASLQEVYWASVCREINDNNVRWDSNEDIMHSPLTGEGSMIQSPMDYIKSGSSWQQNMKKKELSILNSSSSYLTQFGSKSLNVFVQDSPEYIYFPHILNQ